jgi:hypothetical protein
MKSLVVTMLTFMLVSSAWAGQPAESPQDVGPETTLNAAALYLDTIFLNTLASLQVIASTPEAKSGDWNGIKPYLNQLESDLPGAYFFMLPDGNYYTVALDYTNLNVSDRGYFKPLFDGNQIKGFSVYSRSAGKKSAVMATPIVVNNKVTGALGASIFLDNLHATLNRELALPQNYTWFVLNSEGNTMLDRDSDFIFMNALTQGSKSLQEAVSKALKSERGSMQYELGGIIRQAHYCKLPRMDWWMILAKIEDAKIKTPPQLNLSLKGFVPDLQSSLNQIDDSLAQLIKESNVNVEKENGIRSLLISVINENPAVVNAAFVDLKGFLRYIEPRDYKNFENVDISTQDHVIALRKKPMPFFSSGFTAVEGFLAVDVAHPLYDKKKKFVGSISVLIRPELLIEPLLKTSTIPADYELWIMQPDGMIIYDQDKEEIGKMLFGDPMYAEYESLVRLGKKIVSAPIGEGQYIFLAPEAKEKVIKNAVWETIRLHNREWRVVLASRPYEQQQEK